MISPVFTSSHPAGKAYTLAQQLNGNFIALNKNLFPNGEIGIKAPSCLAHTNVILVQEQTKPIHDQIIELGLSIQAIQQLSPEQLIVCLPYLAYSRQDRASTPGEAVGSSLLLHFFYSLKIDHLIVMDLHSQEIIKESPFPIHNMTSTSLFAEEIQSHFPLEEVCLVSPDEGSIERTKKLAHLLQVPYLVMVKQRLSPNQVMIIPSTQPIYKKYYLFIDDMIDTGTTLLAAAKACPENVEKHAYATHGIFSQPARIPDLLQTFKTLTLTDTCGPLPLLTGIKYVSYRPALEKTIKTLFFRMS